MKSLPLPPLEELKKIFVSKEELQMLTVTVQKLGERITPEMELHWKRLDRLEDRMDQLEGRMNRLEYRMENLEKRMTQLETKFDTKMGQLEERMDALEGRFRIVEDYLVYIMRCLKVIAEHSKIELPPFEKHPS